jgi:hypothetical protein
MDILIESLRKKQLGLAPHEPLPYKCTSSSFPSLSLLSTCPVPPVFSSLLPIHLAARPSCPKPEEKTIRVGSPFRTSYSLVPVRQPLPIYKADAPITEGKEEGGKKGRGEEGRDRGKEGRKEGRREGRKEGRREGGKERNDKGRSKIFKFFREGVWMLETRQLQL